MNIFKKWNMGYTKKLAESGDRESAYKMGNYYYEGKIVEQNFTEAVKWYVDASRYGFRRGIIGERYFGCPHPQAAEILARCYRDGTGIDKNIFYAIILFGTAFNAANDRMSGKNKDILCNSCQKQGGELLKHLLFKDVNSSDAVMQYYTGYVCYFYSLQLLPDMTKNDVFEKAMPFFMKSYQNGYADAAYFISRHIRYVEKNPVKALEWLKDGAERGGLVSQYELGDIYSIGEKEMEIAKDKDTAAEWYLKVCEHRDANFFNINYVRKAMEEVGDYYYRKKDYSKAIQYYKQAMASPNPFNPFDYIGEHTATSLGEAYEKVGNKEEARKLYTIGSSYYGDIDAMRALGMNSEQIKLETSGIR